jgi:catechol 2,3-dioxygenase-like lactoylglutathione lyase family enzyme
MRLTLAGCDSTKTTRAHLTLFFVAPDLPAASRHASRSEAVQGGLARDGIPFTSFAVDDVQQEFERLRALGVEFTQEPAQMGSVTTAVFDDTRGNLIQIARSS